MAYVYRILAISEKKISLDVIARRLPVGCSFALITSLGDGWHVADHSIEAS